MPVCETNFSNKNISKDKAITYTIHPHTFEMKSTLTPAIKSNNGVTKIDSNMMIYINCNRVYFISFN